MKKVLIATHVSGFVPQFELNNVKTLQELGYEVHYASNFNNVSYGNDNSRLEGTGIVCHQVDFARSPFDLKKNSKAYRQLKQLLQEHHFELVHCHTPVGAALTRMAANKYRKTGTKVIYTAHGFHFFKGAPLSYWLLFYPVERYLASYTDVLVTINEEDYQRASGFCKNKSTKVKKIPGVGVEIDDAVSVGEKEETRISLGISPEKRLLLSVGELNKNKNHISVIKALRNTDESLCYAICGEGKKRKYLESKIQQYGLEHRVFLLGYRNDIKQLLRAADAFVLPSLREGLSCSLQEAMTEALPVIASDIRGNNELIVPGKGGWLVNPKSICSIRQALLELEKTDVEAYGRFNKEIICSYSKAIVTEKMKQIYLSVLKEK